MFRFTQPIYWKQHDYVFYEGGMDIEAVAEKTPELIFTEEIDQLMGFKAFKREMLLLIWV